MVEKEQQISNMPPRAISPGEATEERMPCSSSKAARRIQRWAAVLTVVAAAGVANMSDGRADEANAKRLFKAMSDYLGAQKAMSFDYAEGMSFDEAYPGD